MGKKRHNSFEKSIEISIFTADNKRYNDIFYASEQKRITGQCNLLGILKN